LDFLLLALERFYFLANRFRADVIAFFECRLLLDKSFDEQVLNFGYSCPFFWSQAVVVSHFPFSLPPQQQCAKMRRHLGNSREETEFLCPLEVYNTKSLKIV